MATVIDDEVLVGKVFNFISTAKGFMTFADLRKTPSPLAIKFSAEEAASWIRDHLSKDKRFAVQELDGKVTSVKIMAKVRLCFQYLKDGKHNCKGGCKYWHVCKDYIEGNCTKQCRHGLSHDFHNDENSDKCEELGFGKLNNGTVRRLVALNSPVVCLAYLQGSCDDPNCSNLHLCDGFVRRSCSDMGGECNLSHNLRTGHNKSILGGYNLNQNIKEKYVLCSILVPKIQMAQNNPKDVPKKPADQAGTSKSKEGPGDKVHCSGSVNQPKKPAGKPLTKSQAAKKWLRFQSTPHSLNIRPVSQKEQEPAYKSCGDNESGSRPANLHVTSTERGCSKIQNQTKSASHHRGQSKLQQSKRIAQSVGNIERSSEEPYLLPTSQGVVPTQGYPAYPVDYLGYPVYPSYPFGYPGYPSYSVGHPVYPPQLPSSVGGFPGTRLADRGKAGLHNWAGKGRGMPILSHQDGRQKPKYQESQLFNTRRPVQRRPEVPPNDEIRQLKSSQIKSSQQLHSDNKTTLPPHWKPMPHGKEFIRMKLSPDSEEFKKVEQLFRKTMTRDKATLVKIERVQNPFMWESLIRKKEKMKTKFQGDSLEKKLFHGTRPEIVDNICKENFDWRLYGRNATVYGQGSYFALNASYSDRYAAHKNKGLSRFMFLADVLVGSHVKGDSSMRRPPPKKPSNPTSDLYDSCVDDERKPEIFVVFESDQCYPSYVIEYKAVVKSH